MAGPSRLLVPLLRTLPQGLDPSGAEDTWVGAPPASENDTRADLARAPSRGTLAACPPSTSSFPGRAEQTATTADQRGGPS
jgi:hypothetical protein